MLSCKMLTIPLVYLTISFKNLQVSILERPPITPQSGPNQKTGTEEKGPAPCQVHTLTQRGTGPENTYRK